MASAQSECRFLALSPTSPPLQTFVTTALDGGGCVFFFIFILKAKVAR